MATLAFLFAPQSPIPAETDPAWFIDIKRWAMAAERHWDAVRREVPAHLRERAPESLLRCIPSGTMMLGRGQEDRLIQRNAAEWMKARFTELQARDFAGPMPVISAGAASQALALAAAPGLEALVDYRRALRPIPAGRLRRGGSVGLIANAASPTEFDVFAHGAPERSTARVLVEAYGGECLVAATWGGAILLERIASPAPGGAPEVEARWTVRLVPCTAGGREPRAAAALRALFAGSALRPDFDAIDRELAAPRISVTRFFEALGLPGAREIEPPDADAAWAAFDAVAAALLAGAPAPKAELAAVNALLAEGGGKLAGKPARPGKGETARRLAEAHATLAAHMPAPTGGDDAARRAVAATAGALDDCRGWREVTFGHGAKGMGPSAAAARMLAHAEPRTHAGDPLALALLALECEALNWHGFVEPLSALAETRAQVGFTAIIAPADEREALDAVLGVEVDTRGPSTQPWTGEVILDASSLVKGDARGAAVAFMKKRKASGVVAHVAADGGASTTYFAGGREVADAAAAGLPPADVDALRDALARLDTRAVPIALGAGDLLAPVDLTPQVDVAPPDAAGTRAQVDARLATAPAPTPVEGWDELVEGFAREVRRRDGDEADGRHRLALRLRVPGASAEGLQALRNDVAALASEGEAWRHGDDELRADLGYAYDPRLLYLLLGDAPAGTGLALVHGEAMSISRVLRPA